MTSKRNSVDHLDSHGEIVLQGSSICPGIGIGHVHIVDPDISIAPIELTVQQVKAEKKRYTDVVKTTRRHLRNHVATVHGVATPDTKTILDLHQAMLKDESFHDRVRKLIETERKKAEWCLCQEATNLISKFTAMRDPYFRARGEDVRDMAHNLIGMLSNGTSKTDRQKEKDDQAFISRHLHSSDVMLAQRSRSSGFASESLAMVSHAAILLKGFGIPSVGGVKCLMKHAKEGDRIIVDGSNGIVIVRPSSVTVDKFRMQKDAHEKRNVTGCLTADGTKIMLKANIENPQQVELMFDHNLDGIGLFRTEFMISADGQVPTEEEQYNAYRSVIDSARGRFVTIRTFDIGADKSMGLLSRCTGQNPALGLRGIRRHLTQNQDEFCTQMRAIFRAAKGARVGILIPMVTTVEDIIETKRYWNVVMEQLDKDGLAYSKDVVLGAMIEIPAAAVLISEILSEVSFISLGTNDLMQYFMAADRDNENVIHYQDATSPAFLWLMEHIIKQARNMGREADVTVCGEVASDMRALPHLLHMGYRSFSVSPVSATFFRSTCAEFYVDKGTVIQKVDGTSKRPS